jgi:hypothetical protein
MRLDSSAHVEHVQPKSHHPALELSWDNFLLACVHCNSIKSSKNVQRDEYLWPDEHNTLLAFVYDGAGRVEVSGQLAGPLYDRARNTLLLVGLDRNPGATIEPGPTDRRWIKRLSAWKKAENSLLRLRRNDCDEMREQVIETAMSDGYWGVWMTVFLSLGDADLCRRLISSYIGTAMCFDHDGNPSVRHSCGV